MKLEWRLNYQNLWTIITKYLVSSCQRGVVCLNLTGYYWFFPKTLTDTNSQDANDPNYFGLPFKLFTRLLFARDHRAIKCKKWSAAWEQSLLQANKIIICFSPLTHSTGNVRTWPMFSQSICSPPVSNVWSMISIKVGWNEIWAFEMILHKLWAQKASLTGGPFDTLFMDPSCYSVGVVLLQQPAAFGKTKENCM